jgi:hypothetical protein
MEKLESLLHLFTLDSDVPVIDAKNWQHFLGLHGKDVVRETLAKYIVTQKPNFPYRNIPEQKVRRRFKNLCRSSMKSMVMDKDKYDVLEKFDYKYSFDDYGLDLIQMGNSFNPVSDYFQNRNRMSCSSYGFRSAVERWENGDVADVEQLIAPIFRLTDINQALTTESYRQAFRLGSYVASQFKPNVAKLVYEMFDAKYIFDMSCGWGDRLAGFWATSGTTLYLGCDPNENTFEKYKEQCLFYHNALGGGHYDEETWDDMYEFVGRKHVIIYNRPAEDLPWDDPLLNLRFDISFSSPPYFSTERYNEGSPNEDKQSWNRYSTFESWRDDFLFPVLNRQFDKLRSGGYMLVNIIDPKIKTKRYPICDDMIDMLASRSECNFLGQIGMRMVQRTKAMKEEDKEEFYDSIFIEPIWTFRKDKSKYETEYDVSTLEKFFV